MSQTLNFFSLFVFFDIRREHESRDNLSYQCIQRDQRKHVLAKV